LYDDEQGDTEFGTTTESNADYNIQFSRAKAIGQTTKFIVFKTKTGSSAFKRVNVNICPSNQLPENGEVTFEDEKKTSEVYSIPKSAYISFFGYSQCGLCTIDGYQLSNVAAEETITMVSGIVSATMGTQDISTSFNIVP
jgi:hypothetical protein